MRTWLWRLAPWAFTILICGSLSAAADLAAGVRAFNEAEQARIKGDNDTALKGYAAAYKELTPLAEQGNPDAEAILAKMYLMGRGVLKDPDQAQKLFEKAATGGNAEAQFFLGSPAVMNHKNIPEGLKWLRLSADQGNKDAMLLLGKSYLEGLGPDLPPDPVQADMWMRLAADQNLPFYGNELRLAEKQMNAAQIAKGKALAEAWKPKVAASSASKPSSTQEKN
jgi:TPR repeat protein